MPGERKIKEKKKNVSPFSQAFFLFLLPNLSKKFLNKERNDRDQEKKNKKKKKRRNMSESPQKMKEEEGKRGERRRGSGKECDQSKRRGC